MRQTKLEGMLNRIDEMTMRITETVRSHVALLNSILKADRYELEPAGIYIISIEDSPDMVLINRGNEWDLKEGAVYNVFDRIDEGKDGEIKLIKVGHRQSEGKIIQRVTDKYRLIDWGDELREKEQSKETVPLNKNP